MTANLAETGGRTEGYIKWNWEKGLNRLGFVIANPGKGGFLGKSPDGQKKKMKKYWGRLNRLFSNNSEEKRSRGWGKQSSPTSKKSKGKKRGKEGDNRLTHKGQRIARHKQETNNNNVWRLQEYHMGEIHRQGMGRGPMRTWADSSRLAGTPGVKGRRFCLFL